MSSATADDASVSATTSRWDPGSRDLTEIDPECVGSPAPTARDAQGSRICRIVQLHDRPRVQRCGSPPAGRRIPTANAWPSMRRALDVWCSSADPRPDPTATTVPSALFGGPGDAPASISSPPISLRPTHEGSTQGLTVMRGTHRPCPTRVSAARRRASGVPFAPVFGGAIGKIGAVWTFAEHTHTHFGRPRAAEPMGDGRKSSVAGCSPQLQIQLGASWLVTSAGISSPGLAG